jgi:outer membrane biosynthesis protein TonB
MNRSAPRFASGLAALVVVISSQVVLADIGPVEPARQICMGMAKDAPCQIDGKSGTCQGAHPSMMYCTVLDATAPSPTTTKPAKPTATEPTKPAPTESVTATPPAPDPAPAPATVPATKPPTATSTPPAPQPAPERKKGGCAASSPESGLLPFVMIGVLVFCVRAHRNRTSRRSP